MSSEALSTAFALGTHDAKLTNPSTLQAGHLRASTISKDAAEVTPSNDMGSGASSVVLGSMAVGLVGAGLRSRNSRLAKKSSKRSTVARKALDQSSRYADLSLTEEGLIANGQHVLVAYIMKPKAGYDYLATAAHFAAESSTGTNVNVCTTDDFTKSVDALVYYIDPENEEMKIAYPNLLFDRNITDGRAMMCSVLTLSIGNNQGMGDVEYGKIYDIYFPPQFLRLFDGPSCSVIDMWRILGRGTSDGGLVVGTIIKPKLGLQPKPFGEACYAFWLGGDFIKNDEPQGNQVFCQMSECIPEVVKAMRAAQKEAGFSKLFSANITADDPAEMIARGKYVLSQFGPLAENCAFLVDGYVAGGTAVTVARRNFPKQFLHYHRAGHGAVTSPQTQRGYTAFVHTKLSRVIGASGIHVGTMSFGKMEGDASDKNIAFMLQDDIADGPYYRQEWEGMIQTTPIISGGMNALRLPAFFENLGHSNVILTAGGGAFGHKDGPKQGATSCRQGEEAWKHWKAGLFGDISLSDGVIEYAKTHEEMKGAFLTFQKDADQIYPGWKEKLGYTGESSVQAASFDWQKKGAAAAFAGSSPSAPSARNLPKGRLVRLVAAAGGEGKELPWKKYGKWEVHKFGGASLETAEFYKKCGDLLVSEMSHGSSPVPTSAIVSAAGGMTDALAGVVAVALDDLEVAEKKVAEAGDRQKGIVKELLGDKLELADEVIANIDKDQTGVMAMLKAASLMRSVPPQMLELVAGLGEVWSAQTLSAYLKSIGVKTAWLDARDVLIVSDASSNKGLGEKGTALETIDVFFDDTNEKLTSWWTHTFGSDDDDAKSPPLVIVTGFVCSTQSGRPTTLKRSGSDYSATIFAKVFDSLKVTMWKNVDGVYSADPRIVSDASSISKMTFDEAMELAYFGGQVLHPSAMIPCMQERIPVYVRNVFNPEHPGTRVYGRGDDWLKWDDQKDEDLGDELPVKALTSIDKVSLVTLTGASFLGTPGVAGRMMDALSNAGVNVILASQGSSEHSITVAVDQGSTELAVESVRHAFSTEISENYETRVTSVENCSIVAVIGEGMKNTPGVSGKFFTALAKAKVNIIAIAQGSSERNVSVVVNRDALKDALQAAHDGFELGS